MSSETPPSWRRPRRARQPLELTLLLLQEARAGNAALGALEILGQLVAVELFHITANGANKLHNSILSIDGDGALVRSRKALSGRAS